MFSAGSVDGNQIEAQATTVGESNINCIGRVDFPSYATEHPDEVTSSKQVKLPCAHKRANAFVREDNESFKALDFEQIVVEEYASEGIERNSKLDDGVLDKTDCQVAGDKQEVFVESNENVFGNIKEKHGHDLFGGDRTSPIALEDSIMDKVGSDSKTEDSKAFNKLPLLYFFFVSRNLSVIIYVRLFSLFQLLVNLFKAFLPSSSLM